MTMNRFGDIEDDIIYQPDKILCLFWSALKMQNKHWIKIEW